MKDVIILFTIIFTISACVVDKKNYTIKPAKNETKATEQIKSEGVYLRFIDSIYGGEKRYGLFCFYRNGIVLVYGCRIKKPLSEINYAVLKEAISKEISFVDENYNSKKVAGGFEIKNKKINIQFFRYIPNASYLNTTFNGEILNDSTIYINSCKVKKGYENRCDSNFTLHFLPMPKPDSTNQWMKKNWYWAKEK